MGCVSTNESLQLDIIRVDYSTSVFRERIFGFNIEENEFSNTCGIKEEVEKTNRKNKKLN